MGRDLKRFVAALALAQAACFGVGIADHRQRTQLQQGPPVEWPSGARPKVLDTETEVREHWGPPDSEGTTASGCRYLGYDTGLAWSGATLWLIAPVPLVVPTGRTEERVYFRDDRVRAVARETSEGRFALAAYCVGDSCEAVAGELPDRYRPDERCVEDPCAPGCVGAQDAKREETPGVGLETAARDMKWNEPAEPFRIAGPLYFVGTRGLGVYLLETPAGLVLIHTGMPPSGPLIEASIRKLGLDPTRIEWMVAGHAHIDHVGGHAYLKKLSGARVATIAEDVELLESGGETDFRYRAWAAFHFEPVKVDRKLRDGETVELGGIAITARLTPGHTKGSTTFLVDVVDEGKTYTVVFPGSTSVNPGYRLGKNPSYPGIADDYRRTFAVLAELEPDIWLGAHIGPDFDARRARAETQGPSAWVDPEGYAKWVASERAKFEKRLAAE